jgi:hypothetical protein
VVGVTDAARTLAGVAVAALADVAGVAAVSAAASTQVVPAMIFFSMVSAPPKADAPPALRPSR